MSPLLTAFWWSFAVGASAAYPMYLGLIALRARQNVSQYAPEGHQKKQGTPTMGGLIVIVAVVIGALIVGETQILPTVIAFGAIGFLDDFLVPRLTGQRGLAWKPKLGLQVIAACMIAYGYGRHTPTDLGLAVFIVLFFSNAYNFVDGLDGLAGCVGIVFALGVAVIAVLDGRDPSIAVDCALACGGLVAFLFLNAPPAKLFMGDVGSLPIGALFGVFVWRIYTIPVAGSLEYVGTGTAVALALLSLLLAAELIPVPLQIASVKLRKKKLFPMTPIHHAFEAAGWPESRVVWFFGLIQLLLCVGAVSVMERG